MTTLAAKQRLRLTADEFYALGDGHGGYELIDGRREVNPMSAKSSRIGGLFYAQLEQYCRRYPGWAFPQETGYRCFTDDPERVRKPDASFIALDRMSAGDYEAEEFIRIVPDVVVEVVSPKDIASKVEAKIGQWLTAGVKVAWVVHPNVQLVREHRADGTVRQFHFGEELTEPAILPGFTLPVADLFRLPAPSN
ncbi:MAG: Uma2 family endonuclease [Planctomycetia bacterium]|nr:Uma2 family endonuclease [Planctomycetia bacterium]